MNNVKSLILFAAIVVVMLNSAGCKKGAKVASMTMSPANNTSMALGTKQQFHAITTLDDGSTFDFTPVVEWSSSSPDVAGVDTIPGSKGIVTASTTTPGTVTITARDTVNNLSVSTALTVTTPQYITVTPTNPYMAINTSHQFTASAILLSSDNTTTIAQDITTAPTVSWSSSVEVVAIVRNTPDVFGSGFVSATLVPGTTTITATYLVSGQTGTTLLTVKSTPLESIAIAPLDPTISLATTTQQPFTATGTFRDSTLENLTPTKSVIWSSSNTNVATIDDTGLASAGTVTGTTTITAIDPITRISKQTTLTTVP